MKKLWDKCPVADNNIAGMAEVLIYQMVNGKPCIAITVNGIQIFITANIGEMIGGAARGANARWQDLQDK